MSAKEFLGYALGTAFVLAAFAGVLAILIVVLSVIPLMLLLFPLTIAIVAGFLAVGWVRHRRQRRRGPSDPKA